jgi:hypothetical protein
MTTTNEKFYLVKYEDNWADEFDIYGFEIFNQRQFDFLNVVINDIRKVGDFEYYFGTNEYIDYTSVQGVRNALEFKEISKEEFETLKKLGLGVYGEDFASSLVERYVDHLEEEEFEAIQKEWDYFLDEWSKAKWNRE